MADSLDIDALRRARGWSQVRLARELRAAAARRGQQLPGDESLVRQVRFWAGGTRTPTTFYVELLREVFGLGAAPVTPEAPELFALELDRADAVVDDGLVGALEAHTQSLRLLDRRVGAQALLAQAEAHVQMIEGFVRWASTETARRGLARIGAEAAALAGWQALDLGRPKQSWLLHRRGQALARESEDPAVIAHVTAQQAYALLDAGRVDRAVAQFEAARGEAGTRVAPILRAWLAAAEAEARAAAGQHRQVLALLDRAEDELRPDDVPYLVLDPGHFARWRGHCLARLGHPEAAVTLQRSLAALPAEFTRAAASLHTDLALAHALDGDRDAAHHHGMLARRLAEATGSARQKARITALLSAEGEQVEQRDECP